MLHPGVWLAAWAVCDGWVALLPLPAVCCMHADKGLSRAATVLRMLYIKDLRELQSFIDKSIIEMQVRGGGNHWLYAARTYAGTHKTV